MHWKKNNKEGEECHVLNMSIYLSIYLEYISIHKKWTYLGCVLIMTQERLHEMKHISRIRAENRERRRSTETLKRTSLRKVKVVNLETLDKMAAVDYDRGSRVLIFVLCASG